MKVPEKPLVKNLIFKIKGKKNVEEFVSIIDANHIALFRNFDKPEYKYQSVLWSEMFVINMKLDMVIEQVMFNARLKSDHVPVHEEKKGKVTAKYHTSDLINLTKQAREKLPEYMKEKNFKQLSQCKSVRGEKIEFSVFDKNKWTHKAAAFAGISKAGADQ